MITNMTRIVESNVLYELGDLFYVCIADNNVVLSVGRLVV